MIGRSFGNLTVIASAGKTPKRELLWLCSCMCGGQKQTTGYLLRSQQTKSCGCLQRRSVINRNTRHGQSGTRLYNIWANMLARCGNANNGQYSNYGGRGIFVCAEWQAFEAFHAWAASNGYRSNLSIDRKDNDGPYAPGNCRWATSLEQSRNKRPRKDQKLSDEQVFKIRADGRPQHEVAAQYNVNQQHVSRIKNGLRRTFSTERTIMKTFNFVAAQGEVNIRKIDNLPAGLTRVAPESGMLVVGHSESGHHHGFRDAPGVEVMERTNDVPSGMKILYAILENPTTLIQDASAPHEPITLDAGIYEMRIAREFDPFAEQARIVAD